MKRWIITLSCSLPLAGWAQEPAARTPQSETVPYVISLSWNESRRCCESEPFRLPGALRTATGKISWMIERGGGKTFSVIEAGSGQVLLAQVGNGFETGGEALWGKSLRLKDDRGRQPYTVSVRASVPHNPARKEATGRAGYYPATLDALRQEETLADSAAARKGYVEGSRLEKVIHTAGSDSLVAWDVASYDFMTGEAPATVNPLLWRQEKLNNINGLFQVWPEVERGTRDGLIYQARGYDLATTTFIKGRSGWIVVDPLGGREMAAAAWACFRKLVDPDAEIRAVIVSHSHVDHYKGVEGIVDSLCILRGVSSEDFGADRAAVIPEGKVLFVAPNGFYDEAISENLYLGNCMSRRAQYMYGCLLPRDGRGHVGSGLGKTTGMTTGALLRPSFELKPVGSPIVALEIDGLTVRFQDVPGTEAPAEFHIYFDDYKALCPGENVTHTMHNLLTSRGAKVRDPKAFARAIDDAIGRFADVEVIVGTHHWPTRGHEACLAMMEKQRDLYAFFNDQVIRMLNRGMNMEEIAEAFRLPRSLDCEFYNRGYYGTVNHNVKAVVQRYIGWWDGHPANYFKYPDEEAARRFVTDMGGEKALLDKARTYYKQGDYRWTVELTRQLVFNNPSCREARYLQADALEQLGYSFESGTWRNIFLSAALELRGLSANNLPHTPEAFIAHATATIKTLSPPYIFEYFATLLKGFEASEENLVWNIRFDDSGQSYVLTLKNGVLHYRAGNCEGAEIVTYKNVHALADGFRRDMLDLLQNDSRKTTYSGMRRLYRYFDILDGRWNIIEPLAIR